MPMDGANAAGVAHEEGAARGVGQEAGALLAGFAEADGSGLYHAAIQVVLHGVAGVKAKGGEAVGVFQGAVCGAESQAVEVVEVEFRPQKYFVREGLAGRRPAFQASVDDVVGVRKALLVHFGRGILRGVWRPEVVHDLVARRFGALGHHPEPERGLEGEHAVALDGVRVVEQNVFVVVEEFAELPVVVVPRQLDGASAVVAFGRVGRIFRVRLAVGAGAVGRGVAHFVHKIEAPQGVVAKRPAAHGELPSARGFLGNVGQKRRQFPTVVGVVAAGCKVRKVHHNNTFRRWIRVPRGVHLRIVVHQARRLPLHGNQGAPHPRFPTDPHPVVLHLLHRQLEVGVGIKITRIPLWMRPVGPGPTRKQRIPLRAREQGV